MTQRWYIYFVFNIVVHRTDLWVKKSDKFHPKYQHYEENTTCNATYQRDIMSYESSNKLYKHTKYVLNK